MPTWTFTLELNFTYENSNNVHTYKIDTWNLN